MSYRKVSFGLGEIYHVFNRSVARQPIFLSKLDFSRAVDVLNFYSYLKPGLRYSHYKRLPLEKKSDFLFQLKEKNEKQVEILAFCLMPNHTHFLVREIQEGGISTFMSNFQNSYAKYFNIKHQRVGALFQYMFKAVRVESDEQLLHICRYIHLNPVTSFVIKDLTKLEAYLWSSYPQYIGKQVDQIVKPEIILNQFSSVESFKQFILDQVNYQRELDKIKHLMYE
ncbi:MAG: transposase [Candidatus Daviesbacteria bacterium]|nr:transposase [Candidatus Daviesbacteria bacterium]